MTIHAPGELRPVDELTLKLLYQARKSDDAKQVAHDHMIETYPEYAERIRKWTRRRFDSFETAVIVHPQDLISAIRRTIVGIPTYKRAVKNYWDDAVQRLTALSSQERRSRSGVWIYTIPPRKRRRGTFHSPATSARDWRPRRR